MDETEIKAVEMTRQIRADHAAELQGATLEERLRFYREKAQRLRRELESYHQPVPA